MRVFKYIIMSVFMLILFSCEKEDQGNLKAATEVNNKSAASNENSKSPGEAEFLWYETYTEAETFIFNTVNESLGNDYIQYKHEPTLGHGIRIISGTSPYIPERRFCDNETKDTRFFICVAKYLKQHQLGCFLVGYNTSTGMYWADDKCP